MEKIRKELKENLPEVEKALVKAGENILTTLENFINNVAEGSGRFFESAFKEEEKKSKS